MAHSREELEIKLTGAPADIAALRRSRLFASLSAGKASWARLVTTYYDTAEGALSKAGASLRVRREAGGLIQAIKAKTKKGGVIARVEEERALESEDEFPLASSESELANLVSGQEALAPVARTVTDRCTVILKKGRTRIEAAFGFGRIEAIQNEEGAASRALAEAELDLVSGAPKTLFRIARVCLKEGKGRLRLAIASKEEQARRPSGALFRGAPEAPLRLDARARAGDALAAALLSAGLRLIEIAPAVTDFRLPEGAHQMRVALRRLRAVEKTFRATVHSKALLKIARKARRFAAALGPARDWDVFLEDALPTLRARADCDAGFQKLQARAEALRAKAWDKAARKISGASFNIFVLDILAAAYLQSWRTGAALEQPAADFARKALDDRLDAARRVARKADGLSSAERHRLRIALKKLRYAAQTFRSLYPREERHAYMSAMSRLQDALGALNDAVIAQELSSRAVKGVGRAAARAAGFICGFRAAEADAASSAIGESWKAFDAMTPFWRSKKDAYRK